uniref:Uncharacterized protein n=1 Tax=Acrobeloides nanus TaxID=290746 RepID=A0A914ELL0_9BILA
MLESCPPPLYESIAHPHPTSEYEYNQTTSEQQQPPAYEDDARFASTTSIPYRMMLQPPPGYVDIRTRDGDTLLSEQQQPPAYNTLYSSKRKHCQQYLCCGFLVFIMILILYPLIGAMNHEIGAMDQELGTNHYFENLQFIP